MKNVGLKLNIQKTKIMESGPMISCQIYGKTMEAVSDIFFFFSLSKIIVDGDCSHEIKSHLLLGRKIKTNLESILKRHRHYFANKNLSIQSYGFSISHVRMWELDYKETWMPKNWCFWTVALEKTRESPLDSKEIQPAHCRVNQYRIIIGRTNAEA